MKLHGHGATRTVETIDRIDVRKSLNGKVLFTSAPQIFLSQNQFGCQLILCRFKVNAIPQGEAIREVKLGRDLWETDERERETEKRSERSP